ncbi:hypothetical protein DN069_22910 [Streptacidiphilus pinicola]|uniref:Sodium:proton antiporter n=1 Tax=Streptacidiphilus pinicola TaxID=2219663 RepID=A0A2X0J7E0_9ACTN|nr:DUF6328 family protein [Streptacidiphilus pinicola]RAG83368.1 hypothetical protein DN069_22910 [Streptacidiphilus pinicola]
MAVHPPPAPQPDRHETPDERADRNLVELLQELRVLQTGVQIVFAFLLGVAFTPRFAQLGDAQQDLYVGTLLLTVIASALFATPVALHRGLFHRGAKRRIVSVSTRLAEIGLLFLALALNGAVLLLLDVVLGWIAAIAITCATVLMFAALWFALPRLLRRP